MKNFIKITVFVVLMFCQATAECDFILDKEYFTKRYSQKNKNEKIKVCVVIHNLGRNSAVANNIVNCIPSQFSVSLSPYHKINKNILNKIRLHAHEVLLVMPMANLETQEDYQDPYKINIYYSEEQNNKVMQAALDAFSGCNCVGISAECWSTILNNASEIMNVAKYLEKEKKFLFLPEMCAEHTLHRLCKKYSIKLLEADYFFKRSMNLYELREQLIEAKKLADATGLLVIAVEENIQNIKTIIDWLLELPNDKYDIIRLTDLCKHDSKA